MSTQMMMSVVSGAILLGLAASSEAATVYEFPADRSFPTNPTGYWSLYAGAENWTQVNQLNLMNSNGTNSWQDPISENLPIYNRYGQNNWTISQYTPWSDAAVLVFTCPQTGAYSLNFRIYSEVAYQDAVDTETIKVFTSTSDADAAQQVGSTISHTWSSGGGVYDDFSVPAYQNISLVAGNKIILAMDLAAGGSYTQVLTYLLPVGSDTNGSIVFTPVPEPAALSLLTLGGLALLRRRRS